MKNLDIEMGESMNKTALRNSLFSKYFENKDGILVSDLVSTLSFVPKTWNKLHTICENNVEFFDSFSNIEKCKIFQYKQHNYLILKLLSLNYIIIDLEKKQNVTSEIFEEKFNPEFFINNFGEDKLDDNLKFYDIDLFKNPQQIVDFYYQNQKTLNLSPVMEYKIQIDNAWTYFVINFINATSQLGFQTSDQLLYERLFLNYDLSPSLMQDAQSKIGLIDMQDMLQKIKTIIIPKEVIPDDLYEQYQLQKSLIKK